MTDEFCQGFNTGWRPQYLGKGEVDVDIEENGPSVVVFIAVLQDVGA